MFFEYARREGFPTQYAENRTSVTVDVLDAGLIFVAVILAFALFISIVKARIYENICLYTRVTITITLGILILLGNFGQEWEVGHIITRTPYKAGSHHEINATLGIKIGLRSVNVTLKSDVDRNGPLKDEIINYNERFHWAWDQGRFGFGPYAGRLQREFRQAQYEGVPTPILWIVDYFVIDGEGFRFGRFYRTAGWYAHIALWGAFPCWLLANLYFRSVVRYGAYCIGIAGLFQLLSNLLWVVIRNPIPLVIPFENAALTTKYGPTFWLTFSSGILCVTISIILIVIEHRWYSELYEFFGIDPLVNSDEKYLTVEEFNECVQIRNKSNKIDEVPLVVMGQAPAAGRKSVILHMRKHRNTVIREQQIYGNIPEMQTTTKKELVPEPSKAPEPKQTEVVNKTPEPEQPEYLNTSTEQEQPEYLNIGTYRKEQPQPPKQKPVPALPPKIRKRN